MLLSSGREGWKWATVPRQGQDDERIRSSKSSLSFISLFLIRDILYIEVVSLLRACASDPTRMVQLHCTRPS